MPRIRRRSSPLRSRKLDQDQVFQEQFKLHQELPLSAIRPSAHNDALYRPASSKDPDIVALAESIRLHGLREPLVVSKDRVILSGHRRYLACRLAGLTKVPCRMENILSTSPAFARLLREYNRQRVKSRDEIAREEIVSADPEESHRLLVEHRRQRARVHIPTLTIEGRKQRNKISSAKQPLLGAVLRVLQEQKDFWPLTDRQIHYALLNHPPLVHAKKPNSVYRNDHASYRATIDILTRARLEGIISFEAIHDPTRPVTVWNVHREVGAFIRSELDGFLKGYYRDLMQSQPNQIEIVGEKNTIDNVIKSVAMEYCIPYTIGRGYACLDRRQRMAQRYEESGKEKLVVLILTDFDPEGEDIAHSFVRSMRDDFGIEDIVPIKVALTHKQVVQMELPPQMKAKKSSSRYTKFAKKHGDDVFELEAVPPERLQQILRRAIDDVLDIAAFNAEINAEKQDAAYLDGVRRSLTKVIGQLKPGSH